VLAWLLPFAPASFGQSHWEVKPSNVTSALNAVAFGAGLFVAVGDDGVILTSPDGEVWTPRVSGNIDRLAAIAFGNGRFVVARQNPAAPILTSPDGITWAPGAVTNSDGTPQQSLAFATVAFGGGRFMTAGPLSQDIVLTSTDGISFHPVTVAHYPDPNAPNGNLLFLTYCDGQFFAIASSQGVYSSADGMKWKWRGTSASVLGTDGISNLSAVYGLAAYFSVDAAHNWQWAMAPKDRYLNLSSNLRAVCYGAGVFVGVDASSGIWTSERGEYWFCRGHFGTYVDEFRGVAFDGTGRFVAVGWALNFGRAFIAAASADPPPPPPPAYTVYSLRALSNGAFTGEPKSVSNSGIVGGSIPGPNNNSLGAILRDGVVTTYPDPVYGSYPTVVTSVNDNGSAALEVAVGSSPGVSYTLGISLPQGARTFPGGGIYSSARSINSSGTIAGNYFNYNYSQQGIYRYDSATGGTVDLGNFGLNKVQVSSISDGGDIAGTYSSTDYTPKVYAFRVSASGQLTLVPSLGGTYLWPVVFTNSSGAVAGSSSLPSAPMAAETHAFLFKDGVTSDIDLFNSDYSGAYAINNLGDVVGTFSAIDRAPWGSVASHPFLYRNGIAYDLNRLLDASGDGWVLWRATGISDNGRIVGLGYLHGLVEPFMAVPTPGSPAGTQTRFVNVSTRLRTSTGDDALIAGFVLRGGPKRVILRAIGLGLRDMGFPNLPDLLPDPTLELFNDRGERVAFNDNFTDLPYFPDRNEIGLYGLSPPSVSSATGDSVIAATIPEGSYTAVVRGKNGTSGNCLVEVYNVDTDYSPGLLNISTRGPVGTGDTVMIGGFVIRGDRERRVLVRGIGPSLAQAGVANSLQDPMLEIHDQNEQIAANDDWRSSQEAEIIAAGFAPGDDRDAAVILTLWPGSYTAIVRGKANGTGNALVEVYALP
jgi:probable HAF family extracellular repeat protein